MTFFNTKPKHHDSDWVLLAKILQVLSGNGDGIVGPQGPIGPQGPAGVAAAQSPWTGPIDGNHQNLLNVAALEVEEDAVFSGQVQVTGNVSAASFIGPLTGNVTGTVSGNAGSATVLQTGRTINGVSFNGSANITVTAAAGTLTGTTLAAGVVSSSLTSVGTLGSLTVTGAVNAGSFVGPLTGTASTATALATSRNINGVAFDGTTNITVTAAASTLTGTTLASNVVTSSLTSVGTLGSLTVTGAVTAGSFAGPLTGAVTGNASTATVLATARNINGVSFNGSANITLPSLFTHATLTYASTVTLDFSTSEDFRTVTLTGVITFATSNLSAAKTVTVRIVGDSSSRALTFPGTWKFIGAAAPTALAANKVAVLSMTSFGTTDADVIAAYSVEP